MTKLFHRILFYVTILLALGLITGCVRFSPSEDESEYYLLSAPPLEPRDVPGADQRVEPLRLGVRRVVLADFLRTRKLVLRDTESQRVSYAEWHLWGGSTEEELERAVSEALASALPQARIDRDPLLMSQSLYDAIVAVRVNDFSGYRNGEARLVVDWFLLDPKAPGALADGSFRATASWTPGDFASLAVAQGQNVGALAEEIAASVIELELATHSADEPR